MTGKQVSQLSGELVAAERAVPFAPGFDLDSLKTFDTDPRFATVRIKPGVGQQGKGKNYSPDILRDIARQVNEKRPSGYKGHQNQENISWEWREPVTAWVGAEFDEQEQALYVKGYVPPTAPELRAQLDLAATGADIVNSVSIFGMRQDQGDEVVAFDLWSIDWTPKGRAGMDAQLVSVTGEQHKEDDVDRDEVIRSLKKDEVPEHLAQEFRNEGRAEAQPFERAVGEMKVILELGEDDDTDKVLDTVKGMVSSTKQAEFENDVDEAIEADVSGELMRSAVKERVVSKLSPGASEEDIKGEIASAKELPHIKVLQSQKIPTVVGGRKLEGEQSDGEQRKGTAWT